jgi:hypothetical protein
LVRGDDEQPAVTDLKFDIECHFGCWLQELGSDANWNWSLTPILY